MGNRAARLTAVRRRGRRYKMAACNQHELKQVSVTYDYDDQIDRTHITAAATHFLYQHTSRRRPSAPSFAALTLPLSIDHRVDRHHLLSAPNPLSLSLSMQVRLIDG